ncbi:protein MIX23-like [Xenia sp. Carnegie-2017]|uniref:protein MIX23-like n=1 Tax=Xenia sp. Carnegie-2017 TaxID=2897299 RepID=UPI001F04019B|nr:protein MIX23-like [Xenia sp. Carnegie-2017]
MADGLSLQMSCEDFTEFKEALKILRSVDDKIIYVLNKSVPTLSFTAEINAEVKCKELHEELIKAYTSRQNIIKRCISEVSSNVRNLQSKRNCGDEDNEVLNHLRNEQTKLRLMQSELNVEDVIKQRSLKVFKEKCWKVYKL